MIALYLIPFGIVFAIALHLRNENKILKRREEHFKQIFKENRDYFSFVYPTGKIF